MNIQVSLVISNIIVFCARMPFVFRCSTVIFISCLLPRIALSDTVNIVSPHSIPPYVIEQSSRGIQLELIKASLLNAGHTAKISYASNKRSLNLLQTNYVDGMINVPHHISGLFYSESVIDYQNGAFTLKNSGLKLASISDLSTLRVIAFQNASKYFSIEYREMAFNNNRYEEVINQFAQLHRLFNQRCDVIVMDKRIFTYFWALHQKEKGFDAPVIFYDILPPSPRLAAFNSEILRDEFNVGLAELKASGRYEEIIDSYVDDKLWQGK